MTKVVSLINMKGGVGKTTLAFNLAWYAAFKANKKILLIDLDPQANASQYLMGAANYKTFLDNKRPTVADLFEQYSPPSMHTGGATRLDPMRLIHRIKAWNDGSNIHLVASRLELALTLKNPTDKSHLLAKFIAKISDKFDLILIDCPPTESILTTAAYHASRYVLVPVKPEFLAAIGLPLLKRSLDDFTESYATHTLEVAGIVFTDSDPNWKKKEHVAARKDIKKLAALHGWYVFENALPHSDSYPGGARSGKPIFLTDYARWWVKSGFDKIGAEFLSQIGL